jgi:hypothetical protein
MYVYVNDDVSPSRHDYYNEYNKDYLKFYDALIVAPIVDEQNDQRMVYGFLCCDAKNKGRYKHVFKNSDIERTVLATAFLFAIFYRETNKVLDIKI